MGLSCYARVTVGTHAPFSALRMPAVHQKPPVAPARSKCVGLSNLAPPTIPKPFTSYNPCIFVAQLLHPQKDIRQATSEPYPNTTEPQTRKLLAAWYSVQRLVRECCSGHSFGQILRILRGLNKRASFLKECCSK